MKRYLLFALLWLCTSLTKSQTAVNQGQCLIFKGQLDKYPITLIMEVFQKEIKARYYYPKFGTIINLEGEATDEGYRLKTLTEGSDAEIFVLKFFHNELMGEWTKGNKKLPVNLVRDINPIEMFQVNKILKSKEAGAPSDFEQFAEIRLQHIWPSETSSSYDAIRLHQFNQLNNMQIGEENASATFFNIKMDSETKIGFPKQVKFQMNRIADTFISHYRRDVKNAIQTKETDLITNQCMFIENRIIYESDRFMVLETGYYDYTGGAHGMFGQSHMTWDKKKNKWVNVEDLLSPAQIKKIPKAMTINYKIANKIPQKSPLNTNGLWIAEFDGLGGDTYFSDLGIHTSFGLYEIAPYSSGIIEVFIPWKDLK